MLGSMRYTLQLNTSLKIPATHPQIYPLTKKFQFHAASDSLTTTSLHKYYAKESTLVFANNPSITGLENIENVRSPTVFLSHLFSLQGQED
jgi:hypothetical protein